MVVCAHNDLSRSRLRVSGLFMALHEVMPHGHAAVRPIAKSELTQIHRHDERSVHSRGQRRCRRSARRANRSGRRAQAAVRRTSTSDGSQDVETRGLP